MDNSLLQNQIRAKDARIKRLQKQVDSFELKTCIKKSLMNCINFNENYFKDSCAENGLEAIINKLTSTALKNLCENRVDQALTIFNFLFKYSFSQVPTRVENKTVSVNHDIKDGLKSKLEILRELKLAK